MTRRKPTRAILSTALMGLAALWIGSCTTMSRDRDQAVRRIERLTEGADEVRITMCYEADETSIFESREHSVIQEWRTRLRAVGELDRPLSWVEERDGEEVTVTEIANCSCATDYRVYFLRRGEMLLEVGLVHVWHERTQIRCGEINLGSDTPLLPSADGSLHEWLRALGQRPPDYGEGTAGHRE